MSWRDFFHNRRRSLFLAVLLGMGLALGFSVWKPWRRPPHVEQLSHEAYVWQRQWNEAVRQGIGRWDVEKSGLLCLQAGEITRQAGKLRWLPVKLDWAFLKARQRPLTLALRITEATLEAGWTPEVRQEILKSWSEILTNAPVTVVEAQFDCDCPTRLLPGFRETLEAAKQLHPKVRWTFTALPAWLHSPDFGALADTGPGYVLQVHWLRPGAAGHPVIFQPEEALQAAAKANAWRTPFRLALPTYGSAVLMDSTGAWHGVVSEEAHAAIPREFRLVEAASDAREVSTCLDFWRKNRPAWLTGLVWYRLPVAGDSRNWSWTQLREVMAGREPKAAWAAVLKPHSEGFHEILLTNTGTADAPLPSVIYVRVNGLSAADALAGYTSRLEDFGAKFTNTTPTLLPADGATLIGWVRGTNPEVMASAKIELQP
jgi:hypothetical protein